MTLGLSPALFLAVFPAGVILAALKDLTSFTIPNWVSGLLILAFYPVAWAVHLPLAAIGVSSAIGVAALLAGMGMFAMGWCGGGDAKLFAVSSLWLGWSGMPPFLLVTGLAGGALALGLIFVRKFVVATAAPAWLSRLLTIDEDLPYGLAIAVGALIAFPYSALVAAAGTI